MGFFGKLGKKIKRRGSTSKKDATAAAATLKANNKKVSPVTHKHHHHRQPPPPEPISATLRVDEEEDESGEVFFVDDMTKGTMKDPSVGHGIQVHPEDVAPTDIPSSILHAFGQAQNATDMDASEITLDPRLMRRDSAYIPPFGEEDDGSLNKSFKKRVSQQMQERRRRGSLSSIVIPEDGKAHFSVELGLLTTAADDLSLSDNEEDSIQPFDPPGLSLDLGQAAEPAKKQSLPYRYVPRGQEDNDVSVISL